MSWLVTLEPDWREVGLSLKVKSTKLKSFHNQTVTDAVKLSNVFDEWERTLCSPHTFEQLISSLEERGYEHAVKTVKEKLQDKKVKREYSL